MRLWKHSNGYFYIISGNKQISLKTKERQVAVRLYKLAEKEFLTINLYKEILKAHRRSLSEIENHYKKMMQIVNESGSEMQNSQGRYPSEENMQTDLIVFLQQAFKLKNVEEKKPCKSGIVDAIGDCHSKRVIIEFKLGSLSEKYLGQCLRYLNDEELQAHELWLVGEDISSTSFIYRDFPKIKLFVLSKSKKAKSKLREIRKINLKGNR